MSFVDNIPQEQSCCSCSDCYFSKICGIFYGFLLGFLLSFSEFWLFYFLESFYSFVFQIIFFLESLFLLIFVFLFLCHAFRKFLSFLIIFNILFHLAKVIIVIVQFRNISRWMFSVCICIDCSLCIFLLILFFVFSTNCCESELHH
jgi:hypothetical protein